MIYCLNFYGSLILLISDREQINHQVEIIGNLDFAPIQDEEQAIVQENIADREFAPARVINGDQAFGQGKNGF